MTQLLDVAVGTDTDGLVDLELRQRETIGRAPGTHNLWTGKVMGKKMGVIKHRL